MSDYEELSALYEAVALIQVNAEDIPESRGKDNTDVILQKIDQLICNAVNFNDDGGLVALTSLKSFIEKL